MSDRQTPNTCSVRIAGSATRGANEYRDDQHAGVDNSVQAAQGSRIAAGVTLRHADPSPLGTADVLASMADLLSACEPPRPQLSDVFLHRGQFLMMMQDRGIDAHGLPEQDGQRYWDWVGGGIRYWDGWRKLPHG